MEFVSCENSIKKYRVLFKSGDLSDVEIEVDDKTKFKCHKFLLAAHSQFFSKLFLYQNVNLYHIGNVSSESFARILSWIYKVN